jgi:ArsR family transcriptional regulator
MELNTALAALGALSHEFRLRAFRRLVEAGPAGLSVGELREFLEIPPATLSAHLNVMRTAGLLRERREGRVIRLFADFERMNALIGYLTDNCCGRGKSASVCVSPAIETGAGS